MRKLVAVAFSLLVALAGCEDFASPTGTGGPGPTLGSYTLQKISGDDQTGLPGQDLDEPYVVKVVDQFGGAVSGKTVRFRLQEGSGGSISSSSVLSGADGNVAVTARLPGAVNTSQTVVAEMDSAQNTLSFTSSTTASLAGAAQIRIISGDDQKGIMRDTLLDPLVVEVTNEDGVALEGVSVKWKVVSGNGGGAVLGTPTTTDSVGLARNQWRLGDAPQTTDELIAFIEPQDAAPDTVTFSAYVTGVPDTIVVTQGAVELDNDFNEPELLVGDTVFAATGGWSRKPLKAIVLDAAGDSVRGARLTWFTTSGGGAVGDEPEDPAGTVHVLTDAAGGITVWRMAPTLEELQQIAPGCVDEDDDGNLFLRTDVQCWIGATMAIEDFPEVTPVTVDVLLRN